MDVTRISRDRLSSQVADRLQEHILDLGLESGSQLPTETELMETYRVSRTVVREATAMLVSRGLVEVRPRLGMRVRAFEPDLLSLPMIALLRASKVSKGQLIAVRHTLETAIARDAARARTSEDLEALRECLDAARSAGDDPAAALRLDMQFHELLAAATHNPFYMLVTSPVTSLLRTMYEQSFGYLALQPDTLLEHERIFAAIEAGDEDGAASAVSNHLERVSVSLETLVQGIDVGDRDARSTH